MTTSTRFKYPNPPIQEAICEVHFDLPSPLSKEQMGRLKPIWEKEYPDQKLVEEKNLSFQISQEEITPPSWQTLGHRLICRSGDGKRLVQLSGFFLAINQLKPYPGWEESFRQIILKRASEFQDVLGLMKFKRVGLRYINRIDVPEKPLDWEKWVAIEFPIPKELGLSCRVFQMHFQNELSEGRRLIVNLVTLPPTAASISSLILDLDLIWEGTPAELPSLEKYLELVHGPHRLAFENYLTDNTRKLFCEMGE